MPSFQQMVKQNPGKYPENLGKTWSDEEVIELLLGIRDKKTHEAIANNLKRTIGGIRARLSLLAWEYHREGKTKEQIQKLTGLDKDQVIDSIVKYEIKQNQKEQREEQKAKAKKQSQFVEEKQNQNQELDLLQYVKELHLMVQALQQEVKELKEKLV